MQYITHYTSPLGEITLASDGNALIGLWFDGQKHDRNILLPNCREGELPIFVETKKWLDDYFAGRKPSFTPALALDCSPFRTEVLQILMRIPYGKTTTYGEIAKEIAEKRGLAKMSAQAVGGAVGSNPISLIIPCHRVVGTGGSLTGYGGGIQKKLALLQLEKVNMEKLFLPKKGTAL